MSELPLELQQIVPVVQRASKEENPLLSVKEAIEKIFQRPGYTICDGTLVLRIESSFLYIQIEGPDRFRISENRNPRGGSLLGFGGGNVCDTEALLRELVKFEDVPRDCIV